RRATSARTVLRSGAVRSCARKWTRAAASSMARVDVLLAGLIDLVERRRDADQRVFVDGEGAAPRGAVDHHLGAGPHRLDDAALDIGGLHPGSLALREQVEVLRADGDLGV